MRTSFYDWRRKARVLALVIACATGWIRSYAVGDAIYMRESQGYSRCLVSANGWLSHIVSSYEGDSPPPSGYGWETISRSSFFGAVDCGDEELAIPYWAVILTLMLLSAQLILRTPRERDSRYV
ncbi:MAG: hypothetical protein JWP89_138 [Schlesneria sp.]|nr:hypothetical protein [Schlesneria sp.]